MLAWRNGLRTLATIIFLFSTGSASASYETLEKRFHSKPYDVVRVELMRQGYRSHPNKHKPSDLVSEAHGFCKKYPEVFDCTGTGENGCVFTFIRRSTGVRLVVTTLGEDRPVVLHIRKPYDEFREAP